MQFTQNANAIAPIRKSMQQQNFPKLKAYKSTNLKNYSK